MRKKSKPNKISITAAIVILHTLIPLSLFSAPQPEILKRSPAYKTISVNVLQKISLPRGYHEGLFLDGTDMWVINGEKGKIWVIDTISGKKTATIKPIAGFTEAVSRISDGLFFVTDWNEKKLYKARLAKDKLVPESWVSVAPAHPAGAAWSGSKLFIITWTRGLGTKFNLLELDGLMRLTGTVSIQNIEEPAHLAWDGENIWITSWYDPLVYKVDIKNREILGAFRSPVSQATGIVWDGKYLWLTGTYSDLYKLDVGVSDPATNAGEDSMAITVKSSAFTDGGNIPSKYTCDGEDVSPSLDWSGIPSGTKTIALISDDPDAPMGTWVHWVMFNIPPQTKGLPENVPPDKKLANGAIQGINDSHQIGYGGPCPPNGVHRYYFKIYALDTEISLAPGATKKDLESAMESHILAKGQLMGRYSRK